MKIGKLLMVLCYFRGPLDIKMGTEVALLITKLVDLKLLKICHILSELDKDRLIYKKISSALGFWFMFLFQYNNVMIECK